MAHPVPSLGGLPPAAPPPRVNGQHTGVRPVTPVDEAAVVRQLRRKVAHRLTDQHRQTNPATDPATATTGHAEDGDMVRRLIGEALDEYTAASMTAGTPPLTPAAESRIARAVADGLLGVGGLQPLLDDPSIEDITANGCDVVWVRRTDGRRERVAAIADSDAELVELVELVRMLAARSGVEERRFDRASPILDLQLSDGSRLNAVMAVSSRPVVSIRRHHHVRVTLADLYRLGTVDVCLRQLLTAAVRARLNIIVAGAIGAGKTTMLRALAACCDPTERIVTIEDSYELGLDADPHVHGDVAALQAREANVEGAGAISMTQLFRTALRMAPGRIVVGEVRGDEVIDMLNAMSQGNDGSLSTIHARSSDGVFGKLALYAAQSPQRLAQETTALLVAESVNLVVHLGFAGADRRVVTSVREVVGADGLRVASNEILRLGPAGYTAPGGSVPDGSVAGGSVPGRSVSAGLLDRLEAAGFDPDLLHQPSMWHHSGGDR
jgi:pilus assembly protein CpaF